MNALRIGPDTQYGLYILENVMVVIAIIITFFKLFIKPALCCSPCSIFPHLILTATLNCT